MALVFKLSALNVAGIRAALERAKKKLDNLNPAAKRATLFLLGRVQRNFGTNSEAAKKWPPLSPLTLFIRRHRQSAPNKRGEPRPLNDRGLLRNANFPFVKAGGAEFGVVNNAKYAPTHQFGGRSEGGEVVIRNFRRRLKGGGMSRVSTPTYRLKLPAGRRIPARPFFPPREEYLPPILEILRRHGGDSLGGLRA